MSYEQRGEKEIEARLQRLEEEVGFAARGLDELNADAAELNRRLAELERMVRRLAAKVDAPKEEAQEEPEQA